MNLEYIVVKENVSFWEFFAVRMFAEIFVQSYSLSSCTVDTEIDWRELS